MLDKKLSGRIMESNSDDSKDAVVSISIEDNEGVEEISFSTDEGFGDYYLVLNKEDLLRILNDKS